MNLYEDIKKNLKETDTQAGNNLEEICSYVYNDCEGDLNNFPDKEQMEYIADVTDEEYNQIKEMVTKAIENVTGKLYSYDNRNEENIELSDRPTIEYLHGNFEGIDEGVLDDTFIKIRDEALENFKEETGVEIWQDGRSGRHVVVENNFDNAYNYDKLCEIQEKWENWLIDEFAKVYPEENIEEDK